MYVKIPADQFFDFDLNQKINLSVDYGFKGKDYVVLFDLYDENPIIENENGELVKQMGLIHEGNIGSQNVNYSSYSAYAGHGSRGTPGTSCLRDISAGTSDLTAGSSALTSGNIYLVYE